MFIEDFIYDLDPTQKVIVKQLHALLSEYPGVHVKARYKIPFYYRYSWICYINPIEKKGVELCFLSGTEMSNFDGALQTKNRKMVAGIAIKNPEEIIPESICAHFQEALMIDEVKKKK